MNRPSMLAAAIAGLLAWSADARAQTPPHDHSVQDAQVGHDSEAHPRQEPAATAAADDDPHGGHAAVPGSVADDHSAHAAHADPHGGHAQHARKDSVPPASATIDPHAGHRMSASDPHAGHATPPAADGLPREPVPVPTDADRAAAFPLLHEGHAHGAPLNSLVRFNRFEAWDADPGTGQAWEGSAWFGGDVQRLWLRSEGEREHGHTTAADIEVLYGRGISAWWDVVAGIRHDFAPGPSQSWAALGMQGMAPYKFEVSATAYLGERGHSAFVAEAEYELLLTNRLVLQPVLEIELHGQDDPARGIGSGLSSAEAGLRLRYEVTRRFAPYVGLVHERSFGNTADYRRAEDEATRETRWVAGVRWWF